jgi:DMSO/TMAO reductase YedYZ molybdopterin-dependent catalytic subunit
MPLEGLRYSITPIGLHYLLTHFDIPFVDAASWTLRIGGRVSKPLELSLNAVRAYPSVTVPVTMECAGNGRARLSPRPLSQPWLNEAVGTAEWMGTPLRLILQAAQPDEDARHVVFTGLDRGIQDGVEHAYERSLALTDAMREEVMLAYAVNGQPLPPQHGFPLRLVVPGWYGMAHVKWLSSIALLTEEFLGLQQEVKYHVRQSAEDPGSPVTRMMPRALMIPPGIPDFM